MYPNRLPNFKYPDGTPIVGSPEALWARMRREAKSCTPRSLEAVFLGVSPSVYSGLYLQMEPDKRDNPGVWYVLWSTLGDAIELWEAGRGQSDDMNSIRLFILQLFTVGGLFRMHTYPDGQQVPWHPMMVGTPESTRKNFEGLGKVLERVVALGGAR